MKKISIHSPGSYNKLKFEQVADPVPLESEVLIEAKAIGVNFADVCVRLGVYQSAKDYVGWPITPGFEVSGIVTAVGSSVSRFAQGDQVVAFTLFNGYASHVCVKEQHVLPLPRGVSLEQGAGLPAVFFTAYHALFQNVILPAGAKVLIHSAAGGVGTALTQLSKAAGFYVVAVIGSSHKREYLRQYNPDVIIDKSQQPLWPSVEKVCPEGFDAVFDANGYTTLKQSYAHLRPTGKLLAYGTHALFSKKGGRLNYLKAGLALLRTPRFAPLDLIGDNRSVTGFNLSYLFQREDLIADCIQGLTQRLESDQIKAIPVTTFDFEQVTDAHRLLESGNSTGKIVLTVASSYKK